MRTFYKAALLSTVVLILLATPILAFLYQAPFTITESTGTDYDMFPATVDANNTFMATNGFMEADALDTRIETLGGSDKPHMVADDRTLGAVPVEGNSQTNLFFTTGESDLTSMNVISGWDGFVTIPDSATLEPGDDFRFEFTDTWIDTTAGTDKNLVEKQDAINIDVSAAESIRAAVPNTETFTPDADAESTSVDGWVQRNDLVIWDTIHDAAAGTATDDAAATSEASFFTSVVVDKFLDIFRAYLLFDTSSIPDGATIISATLRVFGTAKLDTRPWGDLTWNVFSSDPNTDTALVVGDYSLVGATPFAGPIDHADYDIAGFNTFVLNAAGLAAISDTGITKYSIREATYDAPDIEPAWANNKEAQIIFQTADGANPPELIVVFNIAEITATGVTTAEHDLVVGTLDRGDIDTYAAGANIAVNTGAGLLPVRLLEEITLTAPAATVTFSNIDTAVAAWDAIASVDSRHLVIVVNAASDQATTAQAVHYRFNGDAGNNYNYQELNGTGAVAATSRTDNTSSNLFTSISGTTTANAFDGGTILVPHAFNLLNHKATISLGGPSETMVQAVAGRWADNSAITSFTIFPAAGNFVAGSTFQLGVVDERYLIEEQILSGADGTFSFAAIAADTGELALVGYVRLGIGAFGDSINLEFNGDAVAANYWNERLSGSGGATAAVQANNPTVSFMLANTAGANEFGAFVSTISQYADGVNDPHTLVLSGYHDSVLPAANLRIVSHRRNNVAAITSILVEGTTVPNFKDGSMMSLYQVPQFVIERVTLAAPAATITFSNIPQGYESLQIHVYARGAVAALSDNVFVQINGDAAAANYDIQQLQAIGAVVVAGRNVALEPFIRIPAANEGANEFGGGTMTFPQYSASNRHKHIIILQGLQENDVTISSHRWENTEPITDLVLTPAGGNFVAGTVVELVGVMPSIEFQIEIDGIVEAAASTLNVDVSDNASDWIILDNGTNLTVPYAGVYEQSGQALHFVAGIATSNMDAGVIHDSEGTLWVTFWFNLDAEHNSSAAVREYLWSKADSGIDRIYMYLDTTGRLEAFYQVGGVTRWLMQENSGKTTWAPDQWFNVILSISAANGARLILDNGTATTDGDTTPLFVGGSVFFGHLVLAGATTLGVSGIIANSAIGTDDLTAAEEAALYGGGIPSRGVIPADANNIYYLDEGTGVVAVDSGLDGDDGTIGAAPTWGGEDSLFRLWYNPVTIVENTGEASEADAGTAITLDDAALTQANDFWNGAKLIIVTTTDTFAPQGESSVITDFDAALDRLTFGALTAAVDGGDIFTIDFGTLADRAATAQDGRITWGVNPTGVSVTLGSMVASSQPVIGDPDDEPTRDILPPIGVSDWFGDGTVSGATLTNPIRPLITAMSDNTTLTEIQVWRLMGIIAILFFTVATAFSVRQHQGITAIAAGVALGSLVAFDHNIFPLWTLTIAIGLFIGGLVAERSPSL